jgi:N-acetylglutamate synthase-like GNAT family acetyltransferase
MDAAVIRRAVEGDLPRTERLLREAHLPVDGFREHIADAMVAERNSEIVGCVELELYGEAALLRSLVVSPSERGRALGQRLTSEALRLAKDRGLRDVYLLTETADRFFPRLGFTTLDRSEAPAALLASVEFQSACPKTAIFMHRRLS